MSDAGSRERHSSDCGHQAIGIIGGGSPHEQRASVERRARGHEPPRCIIGHGRGVAAGIGARGEILGRVVYTATHL